MGALVDAGVASADARRPRSRLSTWGAAGISRVVRSGFQPLKVDVWVDGEKDLPREEFWKRQGPHSQESGSAGVPPAGRRDAAATPHSHEHEHGGHYASMLVRRGQRPAPSTSSGQALSLSKGVSAPHEHSHVPRADRDSADHFRSLYFRDRKGKLPFASLSRGTGRGEDSQYFG